MRTLSRKLMIPQVGEQPAGEESYSIRLPRRRTRRLFTALALVLGVGAGVAYSRYFLSDQPPLTTVAVAAVGAILGFVLVLMPGVALRFLRKLACRAALARRRAALHRLLERSRRRLNRLLEKDGEDAQAWNALGLVEQLRGDRRRAASCLEKACELEDDGPGYDTNLAAVLAELGELQQAARILVEATRREPSADTAHHNLGVLLSRRPPIGVVDDIRQEVDTLEEGPLLNSLGMYELTAGRLDDAERHFTRAAEIDPVSAAPRANLAIVAHHRGRLQDAVGGLADAALLDPLNPAIVNNLGALVCAAGRPADAARQLSRASLLSPGSASVELNRGCVRLALGHFDEAVDCFHHPSVQAEYPLEATHDASLALMGLDRYEEARTQVEAGLESSAGDADVHTNLGCLAWALDDLATMKTEMRRAAELAPGDVAAAINLAVADLAEGSVQESIEALEALKSRYPSNQRIGFHLGVAHLADALALYRHEMGQRERQDFFRALHHCVAPLDAVADSASDYALEARVNLAIYRYLRRDYEDALVGLEAAAREYPEDGYLQFSVGTCLAEAGVAIQVGHAPAGDELVGRARELIKRARRHLERAADLGEDTADVFCNLGVCAYNLGDTEAAKVAFRRMVQIEDSEEASNKLGLVHAREAQRLQRTARAAGLVSRERQSQIVGDMRAAISAALHYFLKALEWNRNSPVLHGNIGLAYMIRNREDDVEAALRHWQLMRQTGGESSERRYQELTALVDAKQEAKAAFDETVMALRPLDPHASLMTVPPTLAGPRYAIQAITEEMDWRLHSDNPMVRKALGLRERMVGLRQRLARLSL